MTAHYGIYVGLWLRTWSFYLRMPGWKRGEVRAIEIGAKL